MDQLESEVKSFCFSAPKWMQLEFQGFWYGLLSFAIESLENSTQYTITEDSIKTMLEHTDKEFTDWPTAWLEQHAKDFFDKTFSLEECNEWFERLDTVFRDCVPTDLNIFTIYANGESLTDTQWERLYDVIAFLPLSIQSSKKNGKNARTRHIHGRRAITPMKSRRAITHKNPKQYTFIKLQ